MRPDLRTSAISLAAIAMLSTLLAPVLLADPNPRDTATPPPATVSLLPPGLNSLTSSPATLTPSSFSDTLRSGQCVTEHKTLFLPADVRPRRLDLMICMDLTGSMTGELNNVKINTANIINQLRANIPDSDFGVMSHMDYPSFYFGCGYSSQYGSSPADYAYQLNQGITASIPAVTAATNSLNLGDGWDSPEDYTRPLFESYSDAGIGWRSGSRRILMMWGDDIPHDCAVYAILGFAGSTGPDPGRDAIANNGDDLQILPVLNAMAANNITLIVLHSGGNLPLWRAYAQVTGGDAFQINGDGTIPGGTPIAQFIANLVDTTAGHVDVLTLAPCDSTDAVYAGWVASVSPPFYSNITLDHDQFFQFDVTFCVPDSTPDGSNCFNLCAQGDGAEYARQQVCLSVQSNHSPDCSGAVASETSLWPPNHTYHAISVLGVTDSDGDPVTVTVTGITQDEPLNTRGDGNTCPDGQIFNGQASVRAERTGTPGIPGNGRVYAIHFTAIDGRGGSCTGTVNVCVPHDQGAHATCFDDGQKYNSPGPCSGGAALSREISEVSISVGEVTGSQATLEFALPEDAQVEVGVFDVAGRRLATLERGSLAAGVYQRSWDMSGVAKGLYFVRMQVGAITLSRTIAKTH